MSIEEHIDIDPTKISENHLAYRIIIIGISSKEEIVKPIFGYERILYDALPIPKNSNHQNIPLNIIIYGQRRLQALE